jgi:hypothetical protein
MIFAKELVSSFSSEELKEELKCMGADKLLIQAYVQILTIRDDCFLYLLHYFQAILMICNHF